jgi:hypothetical protein
LQDIAMTVAMSLVRTILALALAAIALPAAAIQRVDGSATIEDFEDYDLGRKSIDFCPGFVGPGNTGFDCGFGKLEGGSITAATPEFPAASGNQVYFGSRISFFLPDSFNDSWPAVIARVTSSDSPVTLRTYRYDYDLNQEVLERTVMLGANMTNRLFGAGTPAIPLGLTRFTYESDSPFSMDDLQMGLPDVAPGIPEPASWLMLITGFSAVGGTLRQRRRQSA